MKRTTVFAAAAGAVLAAAGIARWAQRGTPVPDGPWDLADLEDPWGRLPCPPLREGVGHLHDWLASGDWGSPVDVLDALREQAPVGLIVDLVRDLETDLRTDGRLVVAEQLHNALELLLRAADLIGEADYDDHPFTAPGAHPADCPGGCGGDGFRLRITCWDDGVPVQEEESDCSGEPDSEHEPTCRCGGTGMYTEGSFRYLCQGPVPELVSDGRPSWGLPVSAGLPIGDEPPF